MSSEEHVQDSANGASYPDANKDEFRLCGTQAMLSDEYDGESFKYCEAASISTWLD